MEEKTAWTLLLPDGGKGRDVTVKEVRSMQGKASVPSLEESGVPAAERREDVPLAVLAECVKGAMLPDNLELQCVVGVCASESDVYFFPIAALADDDMGRAIVGKVRERVGDPRGMPHAFVALSEKVPMDLQFVKKVFWRLEELGLPCTLRVVQKQMGHVFCAPLNTFKEHEERFKGFLGSRPC